VITQRNATGFEQPSFVLISHGHSIAGLAELAKWTQKVPGQAEQYLFDTSVYMPEGKWDAKESNPRYNVATKGAQVWGDEIAAAKTDHQSNKLTAAGGVAIALNGHRGDTSLDSTGTANINAEVMLGSVDAFLATLKARGLSKVVVVTEHSSNVIKHSRSSSYIDNCSATVHNANCFKGFLDKKMRAESAALISS
jgi:hypothetical protein